MAKRDETRSHDAWASLRFAIVGPLLASPPRERGELRSALENLARQSWRHPVTGEPVHFAVSTIERWYYRALSEPRDPVGALRNRVRQDVGTQASLSPLLRQAVQRQYDDHPSWSVQLHYDNLEQLVLREPAIGSLPSYPTLLRYMKRQGLARRRRLPRHPTAGQLLAREHLERREVRSYETEYALSLWHLDYHEASRKVLVREGRWIRPQMLGVLDDHSRLACHVQWYRSESAESLAHGLSQAIQKRGLPRSLMTEYVPGHIFGLLFPSGLCGRGATFSGEVDCGRISSARVAHNGQSESSQARRESSLRQTVLRRERSSATGGSHALSASCFTFAVISA